MLCTWNGDRCLYSKASLRMVVTQPDCPEGQKRFSVGKVVGVEHDRGVCGTWAGYFRKGACVLVKFV